MTAAQAGPAPLHGRWRLAGLIGAGAIGSVHRAVHVDSGETAALKLLPLDGSTHAERDAARQRFRAEAGAARRLLHAGIVRVVDAGDDGATAWLAMELLGGHDLARHTRPGALLPAPAVIDIAARLADALAHAHRHGVLHRDVKPANVMVDATADRVVLTDFGLARLHDGERTRTGLVLATPAYAAPEQLAGAEASAASDLYALGVLLFELLAGRLPHASASLGALLRAVAAEPAPRLRTLRPELPPALETLLAALLAKRAAQRPAYAAAVASALRSIALGGA